MKKYIFLIVILVLLTNIVFSQKNIIECLNIFSSKYDYSSFGDLSPNDTLIDLNNGYYEEFWNDGNIKIVFFQAAIFINADKSCIFAKTSYLADEQCGFYTTNFFEITNNDAKLIPNSEILPELSPKDFLTNSSVIKFLEKYLPEIKKQYLGDDSNMNDLLNEIYNIHYIIPQFGTTIKATLNICDYIPNNQVSITPEDWEIIETNFDFFLLEYDKQSKKFNIVLER